MDALGLIKYTKPAAPKEAISLYGETAVVRGEGRYTMTLVNAGGAWKVVTFHTN